MTLRKMLLVAGSGGTFSPPPIPPTSTVLFDNTAPGDNAITPEWISPDAANVAEGYYLRNLGDSVSSNPGPQVFASGNTYPSQSAAGSSLVSWTGDACIAGSGGTSASRLCGWGLLASYAGLVHLMNAGDGSIGVSTWQLHLTGHIRHGRPTTGGGTYHPKHFDLRFYSNSNALVTTGSATRLVDTMARGTDATFDETVAIPSDAQSFALISLSTSGTEHWIVLEALFIELLTP